MGCVSELVASPPTSPPPLTKGLNMHDATHHAPQQTRKKSTMFLSPTGLVSIDLVADTSVWYATGGWESSRIVPNHGTKLGGYGEGKNVYFAVPFPCHS
jgi:hypothetical protein